MWLQLRESLTRHALGFQRLPWQIRLAFGSGAAVTSIAVVATTVLVFSSLPSRDAVRALRVMTQATVFYDAADAPVFMLATEHRIAVPLSEVTLQAISAAFTAFANGGLVSRPFLIRRVTDHRGAVLFEWNEPARRVLTPENAYRMADMLADVIDHGTAWTARQQGFRLAAAGKTGTTNEFLDAWFIGFTPSLLAGVWVGYDQPRTIRANGYASDVAVPIWTEFMKAATRGQKSQWLKPPPGIARSEYLRNVASLGEAPTKRGFWAKLFGLGRD
jgi:penicillin-binding protein 1A